MVSTRLARADEVPGLMGVYAASIRAMEGTPEDVGWEMGVHPSRPQLDAAAARGELLVAPLPDDGRLAGCLVVDGEQAQGYEGVPWLVEAPAGQVAVLHLFTVAPWARGRGVARALLDAAAGLARARGCTSLRLDVFPNAAHAVEVYRACGFVDHGLHELRYPTCENTTFRLLELPLG